MSDSQLDELEKGTPSPGMGESNNATVLTPEVVKEKKPRYSKSRKGMGGRPVANPELDRPVVKNFIAYLLRRRTSDSEIARLVNCPWPSFHRWKKKNIELWTDAQQNSEMSVADAERALADRVRGHWVERPIYNKDGTLKGTKFHYYPPSDTAIQYYLNNRAPQNWKSKVEHNNAIEELPMSIIFEEEKPSAPVDQDQQDNSRYRAKAITDDYGNVVYPEVDDHQGNKTS